MKILIAEDDVTSRTILTVILNRLGHQVVTTVNGFEAWKEMSKEDAPKVAILDWMMPEMDGIEVCRRIRSMSNRPYTYIILQTAKVEKQDVATGYSVGIDDYLTKPLNSELLKHKLIVAQRILAYEDKIGEYATKMELLAEERGKQLAHADRLATLGTLASGIAHEVNNPVTFISGNAQMLELYWSKLSNYVAFNDDDLIVNQKNNKIKEQFPVMIDGIKKGVERITKIVSGLKSFARENKLKKEPFDIQKAVNTSLELCNNKIKYKTKVEKIFAENLPMAIGDMQQIEQVIINLIVNAADAMQDNRENLLIISVFFDAQMMNIVVSDTGSGVPDELIEKIFNPFFTTKSENQGTGLGLSISKGIIEEHGGLLSVRNREEGGAEFSFTLPIVTP